MAILSDFDIFVQTLNSSSIPEGIEIVYMTDYFLNVPSQKFPVPKITKQTKSHSLNFNVLSSVIDSSGEEVWVSFDSDNYFYVKTWFE